MARLGKIVGWIAALGVVGLSIFLIYYVVFAAVPWLINELSNLYNAADKEFKLGLLTALLSTAALAWSVIYQRRRELESLRYEQKRHAYTGFFDLLFEFIKAGDTGADLGADPEFKEKFRNITKAMMVWADAKTVNAFNEFLRTSATGSSDVMSAIVRTERLMRQFRADLGHNDRWLKRNALSKLLIKGDEHHLMD